MKYDWRKFFTNFRGERLSTGDGEEQRYQAFKARFLWEMKQERAREVARQERIHGQAMEAAYGSHGQG